MTLPKSLHTYFSDSKVRLTKIIDGSLIIKEPVLAVPLPSEEIFLEKYLEENKYGAKKISCQLEGQVFDAFRMDTLTKEQYLNLLVQPTIYGLLTLEGLPWSFFGRNKSYP